MTAADKIKQKLIHMATGRRCDSLEEIRDAFAAMQDDEESCDAISDAASELRGGTERTGLPCPSSRHYESVSVAAEMLDGTWVGWTCWYGGGKYGEPKSIPWIEDAYDVTFVEVPVVVKKFSRVE